MKVGQIAILSLLVTSMSVFAIDESGSDSDISGEEILIGSPSSDNPYIFDFSDDESHDSGVSDSEDYYGHMPPWMAVPPASDVPIPSLLHSGEDESSINVKNLDLSKFNREELLELRSRIDSELQRTAAQ
jgi:hypothetical protein